MTSLAERECYYRLALDAVKHGAVIELGAWLGASTAFIAGAMRDSGLPEKVRVYDRFVWQPEHQSKGAPNQDMLGSFKQYLGPLLEHVSVYHGEISEMTWGDDPISLIVFDAPKRIPAISAALTATIKGIRPGTLMAWQDFAHFPSYDIPAAVWLLGDRVEFVEAVYPGTTAVFRVVEPWTARDVTEKALSLSKWRAEDIERAWLSWSGKLPEPMRARFACGATMFLHDIGETEQAVATLQSIVAAYPDEVLPKWRYLHKQRGGIAKHYSPLFAGIGIC